MGYSPYICVYFIFTRLWGVFKSTLNFLSLTFTQSNNLYSRSGTSWVPFITGSHPSGLTNGISVVRTIYSTCQLSNVGMGMRAVCIYNILILILVCSWISTGILPVASGFISYI